MHRLTFLTKKEAGTPGLDQVMPGGSEAEEPGDDDAIPLTESCAGDAGLPLPPVQAAVPHHGAPARRPVPLSG
jgi:hypothetical protein